MKRAYVVPSLAILLILATTGPVAVAKAPVRRSDHQKTHGKPVKETTTTTAAPTPTTVKPPPTTVKPPPTTVPPPPTTVPPPPTTLPPPPPPSGLGVGVQFHCWWSSWTDAERIAVLDKMKAAGMTWVRIDMGWSSVEQTKGSYYWSLSDKCVQWATERGIKVLGTLWRTPGWANGNQGVYAPPTNYNDYGNFAQTIAARYNGLNGHGKVAAWEVWNEPDPTQSFWTGTTAQYVALVKASYGRFHAGDPATKVVVGGPAGNRTWYINQMYLNGLTGAYFDVISVHPYQTPSTDPPETPDPAPGVYDWPGDALMSHTPSLHQLMVNHGDGAKPIWWTEFGWSTNTGGTDRWDTGVSEAQQGDFFVRALKLASSSYPWVTNVFWYDARNDSTTASDHNGNYGLLRSDLSPKPAYATISNYLNGY
ncbi:MAG: polysaccharide biosynthesis protein PslG [Actinomycetota bacterium]|jgi:hypothetical protein|nr:polysaccharide biosynthesis protein PslG [Actinomycetota bacterium]